MNTLSPASASEMEAAIREFGARLAEPWWRLTSGALYKIMVKEAAEDEDGKIVPYVPNEEQKRLYLTLHTRNVNLKCRQIGSTTAWSLYLLDHALFVPDQRCGLIAHRNDDAEMIFRDKVRFAYDRLPEPLREAIPNTIDRADELLFDNNSSVRVSTSMRSGTIDRLVVTEYGKMSAQFPSRADEVETGSFPAAAAGVIIVESTAEGREGNFFKLVQRAKATTDAARGSGRRLNRMEWRFNFIGWWQHREYRADPTDVAISPKEHEYFDLVGAQMRTTLDLEQRAWYVLTRDNTLSGDVAKMWQEHPSTPDEAFQQSSEGKFFAREVAEARAKGRITKIPFISHVPVNTFWDIGNRDGTGIWVHQHLHPHHRFLRYFEGWGEPYSTFIKQLDGLGVVWGRHFLPHDASYERQGEFRAWSPLAALREMKPTWRWEIVPRVEEKQHAVTAVREVFGECLFDEDGCKEGVDHLALYSKRWVPMNASWSDEPLKNEHTEAADSFMQFAQAYTRLNINTQQVPRRRGAARRMS